MNQESRNLRRSIKNDRVRRVYVSALGRGWTPARDGAGHLRMTAPDGAVMTMSMTQVGARAALNVEAVFKRWLRQQEGPIPVSNERIEGAIDRIEDGISIMGHDPEPEPVEEPVEVAVEEPPQAKAECPVCHKTFSPMGMGRHRASHLPSENLRADTQQTPPSGGNGVGHGALFTIEEILTIAEFGGSGGLIEVTKLGEGLRLVASMRGK